MLNENISINQRLLIFYLQIRILVNQSLLQPICTSCDLLALRLASFNQILDPWVYILLRKENIVRFVKYVKRRQRSVARRLSELQQYGSERLSQFRNSFGGSQSESERRNYSTCESEVTMDRSHLENGLVIEEELGKHDNNMIHRCAHNNIDDCIEPDCVENDVFNDNDVYVGAERADKDHTQSL